MSLKQQSIRTNAIVLILGLCFSLMFSLIAAIPASASIGVDDYPFKDDPRICGSSYGCTPDGSGFYIRECTSFVAWRLRNDNGYTLVGPIGGGAQDWGVVYSSITNTTPAPGSVAWWSSGHVAYVDSVSGSNVTVEQYNWNQPNIGAYPHAYSIMTLPIGSITGFIHFKDSVSATTHPSPSTVSWGSGRIDVFVQGTDGQIYQKYFTSTSGWSTAWARPVDGAVSSGPAVASWGANRLDVFARGSSGDLVHSYFDGTSWHGYESLGGSLSADVNPSAVSWGSGRIDVFVQGTDGQIYQKYFTSSTGWSTSWTRPVDGAVGSGPTVSSWGPNRLDVFARGSAGDLVHSYFDGTSWHSYESLGGNLSPGVNPTAVSWGANRIDAFIQGTDGQIYQKYFTSTSGWSTAWARPVDGTTSSGPAVSSWGANRLDVFARGISGDLVHSYFDGTSWHSYESLGGSLE